MVPPTSTLPVCKAQQYHAAALSRLHGTCEKPEDMPTSCEGCGNCCGRTVVADAEDIRRVERYASSHHLEPIKDNRCGPSPYEQMCGWLDPETKLCRIYPARPKVCRCWGSPHDGELIGTRRGQPCGLRADMLDVWYRCGDLGTYDTWESEWFTE